MGTKQLIILLAGCLLLPGCSGESYHSPETTTGEKVPVSVNLIVDQTLQTKSTWDYDTYFPEIREEEKEVSNILLVVFNDMLLEEFKYFDEADFTITNSGIQLGEAYQDPLDLSPGPHYFYAILNTPEELYIRLMEILTGKEDQLKKEDFEKEMLEKSLDFMTGNGDKFIMTNTEPPAIRWIYSGEQLEQNSELNNDVQINVGRTVGKVSFAYVASGTETGELHGKLQNIRYMILNKPAQMYLMPVIENEILLTPHYYDTSYPADYFTPSAGDPSILEPENSQWLPATTKKQVDEHEELAYGYCIENNNKFSLKSNSTMLLIEGKFTPAVWLNGDGSEGTPAAGGTFFRIGEYNSNGVLYAYLQGYYNDYPAGVLDELGNPEKGKGYYKAIKYANGITYYGFWLRYNKQYRVKRNNYYKVAITHIHGAGEPGPGDVIDPDVDPDDKATNGRLAITAVSWVEDNREVIFGSDPDDSSIETGDKPDIKDWEEEEQEETLDGDNKFN